VRARVRVRMLLVVRWRMLRGKQYCLRARAPVSARERACAHAHTPKYPNTQQLQTFRMSCSTAAAFEQVGPETFGFASSAQFRMFVQASLCR
jgi:hypothetical protein